MKNHNPNKDNPQRRVLGKPLYLLFLVGILLISSVFAYTVEDYGVGKERIQSILSLFDYRLDGIQNIQFIYSNPEYRSNAGLFIPDSNSIIVYVYKSSDAYYQYVLFHELKHHDCWKTNKYLGHEGCFVE